jgi:hypothetical protein
MEIKGNVQEPLGQYAGTLTTPLLKLIIRQPGDK